MTVYSGSFPGLQAKLFEVIADLQDPDPLRPVNVVVASNLLGVHVRRRYLEWREREGRTAAHAAIRFATIENFATDVAGPGPPPLPEHGGFAVLSDGLARFPEARAFGGLVAKADFVPSLEATIRDLVDAGVSPKMFRAFSEDPELTPERRLLLGAVARLYEHAEKATAGYETAARLLRRAAARPAAVTAPVLLYGFYDATGAQSEFLASMATRPAFTAFVPRPPGRDGEFADPFLRWVAGTAGSAPIPLPEPDPEERDPARPVSAASAAGERTEIGREIAMAAADGIPLHRIGVIVRESTPWSNALSRELTRLGVPNFEFPPPSSGTSPLGRGIRLWWDLEERDFLREDVLEIIHLLAETREREIPVSARRLARRAGIVRGDASWKDRLGALAASTDSDAERAAALALADDCSRLVESASSWRTNPGTWSEWADEMSRRFQILFSPAPVPESLRIATEGIAALEDLGGRVERPTVAHVFFHALDAERLDGGRLGRDGVFVGTAMGARGLTFDATVVCHLVEREFPIAGRPDPLLFDAERLLLRKRTGKPVPLKVEPRMAEERLLFGIATGSAARRLVLTTSRRDEALTRDCLPSPFFASTEPVRSTSLGRPVSFGPAVSAGEAKERTLDVAGPLTLSAADSSFARATARRELVQAPRWTVFEGRLGGASRPALASYVPAALPTLSASRLARFAVCPYRYFLRDIQRLKVWEEPDLAAELGPLALGRVFHDAAARIALEAAAAWPPSVDDSAILAVKASEAALAAHEAKTAPLTPPLIREIARKRIEELVQAWLAHERNRGDELRPAGAEIPIAKDGAPYVFDAGPFAVRFEGYIDRMDEDRGHRPARVIDYKVKLAAGFKKAFGGAGRVLGGEAPQLPVYASALGGNVASEYLVVRSAGTSGAEIETVEFSPEETREATAGLRHFLLGMESAVSAGAFIPRTAGRLQKEPCSFCDYAVVCGPGHVDAFALKEGDEDAAAAALRRLRDLP